MLSRRAVLAVSLLAAGPYVGAAAADTQPPEPDGLWSGPMQGAVPNSLAGATVLPTVRAAAAFIDQHNALPIDVVAAPERPAGMAPGMPWLPAAHQDIEGSLWLPGAGTAVLQPDRAAAFLAAVATATGQDPDRFVVLYCHTNCWASWNAAKFLVQSGYRHVAWFPLGIEGWAGADLPLGRTAPTIY